jgi:hypothetical protein
MKPQLTNNTLQLKKKMENFRKELNALIAGTEKYYRNEKILEMSTALDEIIVEYMKVVQPTKRNRLI